MFVRTFRDFSTGSPLYNDVIYFGPVGVPTARKKVGIA
jgi:hypothetical protein